MFVGSIIVQISRDVLKIRLCALTDIFGHLNKLNLLLQGRQKLLCNLYEELSVFTGMLSLFKVHAESGNFLHFPFTIEVCGKDEERTKEAKQVFVGVSESLLTASIQ